MICDKVAPLPMTDDFVAIETAILAHAFQSSSSFLINYGLYTLVCLSSLWPLASAIAFKPQSDLHLKNSPNRFDAASSLYLTQAKSRLQLATVAYGCRFCSLFTTSESSLGDSICPSVVEFKVCGLLSFSRNFTTRISFAVDYKWFRCTHICIPIQQ